MVVTRRSLLRAGAALLLAAQCANAAPAFAAVAPAKPAAPATKAAAKASPLVTRAQGYYRDARYDEAVGLLAGPVLRKELAGDDLLAARVVLARCYVKKGLNARAKEYFGAVLATNPEWTADTGKLDDEERAIFDAVKGVPAAAPAPVAAKSPETKPANDKSEKAEKPKLHKPDTGAVAGAESKPGWLARNKFLAIGLVVAGGVGAGLAAGGGGGGGSSTPPGPSPIPGFPSVPGGH